MRTIFAADSKRCAGMTTEELRQTFLVESLFKPGNIELAYVDVDRAVIGGAVPLASPLVLESDSALRAAFFTERRELGILNVGGKGSIRAGGASYDLENLDCLYIGRGIQDISFASNDARNPAQFYLLSYPAHAQFPVGLARKAQAEAVKVGAVATCNQRTIYKYIHAGGIKSCQLVMGFTQLETGSIWNTMPPHTHLRRSEVYFYFNLPAEHRVVHLMGPGDQTRHLMVADRQAVISPPWSIHAGAGTTNYSFCWGMGGENQTFDDMDGIAIAELK